MRKVNLAGAVLSIMAVGVVALSTGYSQASDSFGSWGGGSSGGSGGGLFRGGLLGRGSHGGSWGGGHVSIGGSNGGWAGGSSGGGRLFGGSHGTGPVRNMLGRVRDRFAGGASSGGGSRGWGGSSGGWGSSGGSISGYGSYGGSNGGSSGGHAAWSVPSYSAPYYEGGIVVPPGDNPVPANQQPPVPTEANPAGQANPPQPQGGDNTNTSLRLDETVLNINLPAESLVFVNGKPTKSTGGQRTFVVRRLVPGKVYTFEVKAILNRDGQEVTRSEIVSVSGGNSRNVAFDFDAEQTVVTTVAVNVPADARVQLAGNDTNRTGENRVFSTKDLAPGQSWNGYTVVATIVRDGKTITREKTIDVNAGNTYEMSFDFSNDSRVAAR